MPGVVLGGGAVVRALAGLTAVACALQIGSASARVVDTGQTQCCSSISPEIAPATNYGATMFRSDDAVPGEPPPLAPLDDPKGSIDELEALVYEREGRFGAMAPELVEPLADLATAYLARGRYTQAVEALSRGIHLARLSDGLHTPRQIDMLETLIDAHVREGNFRGADEQQRYLYRVLSYRQNHGSPELREATLRFADWMRGAYLGDIDRERFPRLVGLNDLYENAIEEIEAAHGKTSRELLPFLEGRAQLSYLISVYPGEEEAGFPGGAPAPGTYDLPGEARLRFWRMRDHNFRYGLQALRRRSEILEADPATTPLERAEARLAIADWHQWHHRYAQAIRVYEETWSIADLADNPKPWLAKTFVEPLELPRQTIFRPGPVPLGTRNNAEVAMRFDVSRHGEAKDITVLSEKTPDTQSGVTRAYHYLRNLRFRPRLTEGTVVRAEDIERRYLIRY